METKKRYKDPLEYVTPKMARRSNGTLQESEFDEVEVTTVQATVEERDEDGNVTGLTTETRRVTVDQVESFEKVAGKMAADAAAAQESEEESEEDE